MTNLAMQQGGAGGAAPAPAQPLPPDAQQAVDMAMRLQAEVLAQAAAQQAAAQQSGAQGQPGAVVRGPDGSIVIRDGQTGESIVIDGNTIPPWVQDGPTTQMVAVPIALFAAIAFVIVGLPIARAFARRMDRKDPAQASVAPSAELRQLQTSIDTMAVEIERMSEHQRFLTRVLSDGGPAGAAPARDTSSAVPR